MISKPKKMKALYCKVGLTSEFIWLVADTNKELKQKFLHDQKATEEDWYSDLEKGNTRIAKVLIKEIE